MSKISKFAQEIGFRRHRIAVYGASFTIVIIISNSFDSFTTKMIDLQSLIFLKFTYHMH